MQYSTCLPLIVVLVGGGAAGCRSSGSAADQGATGLEAGSPPTCKDCVSSSDCGSGAACVQFGGSDHCARLCKAAGDCPASDSCIPAISESGSEVAVCVPKSGSCDATGCGTCQPGTTCDVTLGQCVPAVAPPDIGTASCGVYDPPDAKSCCKSCSAGSGSCQTNGCYGGWWCDHSACKCHAAPTSCGQRDAGVIYRDFGPLPTGTVGPNGGSVSRLFFAVVGDTRPPLVDDTNGYPSAIIGAIYKSIEAMSPRPQFIVSTGDYMFATASGSQGAAQIKLYQQARSSYSGTVFPVMGNHECTGATDGNCAGAGSSNNYQAFMSTLVAPLGRTAPYFSIPITDTAGQWTAKLVVVACNAWDQTQAAWLQNELAVSTTYTFIARHEPSGTAAPCNAPMSSLLQTAKYNLLIVGHTHTYSHSGKQLIEGVGGAPITGSGNYGWATVAQLAGGGFSITQYDYSSGQPVSSFTVP